MIGQLATWYLFLAGAGAGALLVTVVLEMLTPYETRCASPALVFVANSDSGTALRIRATMPVIPNRLYQRFFGPAYGAGLFTVAFGMVCLLADLGRPDRVLQLLLNPSLSFISVGIYLLLFTLVCAIGLCIVWTFGASFLPRWLVLMLHIGCVLGSFAVMTYTGLLLSSMQAIPFWHTVWIPVLFVLSDLSAGAGLCIAVVLMTSGDDLFRTTLSRIKRWDVIAIGAQALCLVLLLGTTVFRGLTAQASATMLLSGSVAPQFWIMVVGMGIVFPLLVRCADRFGSSRVMLVVSASLLISCFFLRWCIVYVGMAPDLDVALNAMLGVS